MNWEKEVLSVIGAVFIFLGLTTYRYIPLEVGWKVLLWLVPVWVFVLIGHKIWVYGESL